MKFFFIKKLIFIKICSEVIDGHFYFISVEKNSNKNFNIHLINEYKLGIYLFQIEGFFFFSGTGSGNTGGGELFM